LSKVAYLDSSFLLGILFQEASWQKLQKKLEAFDYVVSTRLMEAEVRSALKREDLEQADFDGLVTGLDWIQPNDELGEPLKQIFDHGYLRGADAYHLAAALWLVGDLAKDCTFLSLDQQQSVIAKKLGFAVN